MSPEDTVVVEIFGDGKTEVRLDTELQRPSKGVLSILVYKLCGKPQRMRVKSMPYPHLQRGSLSQKVRFARQQAAYNGSQAVVFVVDTEGNLKDKRRELEKGRKQGPAKLPMAVGVAHPCIESWLLADCTAIRRALGLKRTPNVPETPEDLPAPCKDRDNNPKTELARIAGVSRKEASAKEKDEIATAMNDLDLVRGRCPVSFKPFAKEVATHVEPLFGATPA